MSMILHCGANNCTFDDLRTPSLPEQTQTYYPIGHYDLASNIRRVADDLLVPKGYMFHKESFGMTAKGQRMFGLFNYKNSSDETCMAIGFRNSYDMSMAVAIALGASVFVCDNLAISGDITVMRKHTRNVESELIQRVIGALYMADEQFLKFQKQIEAMRAAKINARNGAEFLGYLMYENILAAHPFSAAMRQWREPEHKAFVDRNVWSLYNAVTGGMKKAPPETRFQLLQKAHEETVKLFCNR
jgi:hypothetical protein